MKKRLVAILLVIALLVTLMPMSSLAHSGLYNRHKHSWQGIVNTYDDRIIVKTGDKDMGQISQIEDDSTFNSGDTWHFKAEPKSGYVFDNWTFENSDLVNVQTDADSQDLTISYKYIGVAHDIATGSKFRATANFAPDMKYTLTTSVPGGHGSIAKDPDQAEYTPGTPVELRANADSGYRFKEWAGDATGNSNPTTVTMNGNKTVTAEFELIPRYALNVTVNGNGSVDKSPDQADYQEGDDVTLTATAGAHAYFTGWGGDASGTGNSKTITMDAEKNVTADFTNYNQYTVTFDLNGHGTFTSNGLDTIDVTGYEDDTLTAPAFTPASGCVPTDWDGTLAFDSNKTLNMGFEYKITFVASDHMTITGTNPVTTSGGDAAAPTYTMEDRWTFGGWDRALTGFTAPATVTANEPTEQGYITLAKDGGGYFEDRFAVQGWHDVGDMVALSDAGPDALLLMFVGWRDSAGNDLGKNPTVKVLGDATYTAVFRQYTYLETTAGANGSLGNDLTDWTFTNLYEDQDINLSLADPTPDDGYHFDKWVELDRLGNYDHDVTLTGGEPIVTLGGPFGLNYFQAEFEKSTYTLSYDGNDADSGDVTQQSGLYDTDLTVAANGFAKNGYDFVEWNTERNGGGDRYSPGDTFTIPAGNTTLYAQWSKKVYTVTYKDSQGEILGTEQVQHGDPITKTAADFTAEFDAGERASSNQPWEGMTVTDNTTITVNTEYEVTFDANGGSVSGSNDPQWIGYGGDAAPPSVTPPTGMVGASPAWTPAYTNITEARTCVAQYDWVYYTLTINYLDSTDNTKTVAPQYTDSLHYSETYDVASPAVLGYDVPSSAAVSGTMPENNVAVNVYYDPHKLRLRYVGGTEDVPSDLREWRVFHVDTITGSYPVEIGYEVIGSGDGIIPLGSLNAGNTNANPIFFNTNEIGVDANEKVKLYWYDTDNSEWVQVQKKTSGVLYEITYDANGGEFADGSAMKYDYAYNGQNPVAPDQPVQEAFVFTGWDIDGNGVIDAADDLNNDGKYDGTDIDVLSVSASVTIKALWTPYTFKVKPNNAIINGKVKVIYNGVEYVLGKGDQVTITAVKGEDTVYFQGIGDDANGYEFDRWHHGPHNNPPYATGGPNGERQVNIYSNTSYGPYPHFKLKEYTVEFVDYDGTSLKLQENVTHGTAATAPVDPTRNGYDFTGWDNGFSSVTSNMTVTATYKIKEYTVEFVDYDGTVVDTQTVEHFASATAPAHPDNRTGYSPNGWIGDYTDIEPPTGTTVITITADYVINDYDLLITYVDQDGETLTASYSDAVTFGNAYSVASPVIEGYTLADASQGTVSGTMGADTVEVEVVYNINTYTVTFVDFDDTVLNTAAVDWNTAASAPSAPTRTGYTFAGWDTAFNAVTENLTVKATYTVNTYTVTFVDYDGTVLKTGRVDWNEGATPPDEPEREGYTFSGWDGVYDAVTSYRTITAQYDINTYTVTFVDFDGSEIDTQTVDWNTGADAPDDPERDGYTFDGWDKEFSAVTENMTVTAQYKENEVVPDETVPEDGTQGLDDENVPQTGGNGFAWWWIAAIVGALLVLFFIIFFWKRRKKEEAA